MFYVYDIDGLQFKGPMEALEQNKRVRKSEAVNHLKFDDHLSESTGDGPKAKAAATYQKMVQKENMIEPLVHIYQIMSSPVSTITPSISLVDAWNMLKSGKIRQLVVTNDAMEAIYVLSDRDILKHINIQGDTLSVQEDLNVSDVITGDIITTDAMSDIRRVARVMAFYRVDAMPVLQNERLVGIVTRGDILRGFADNPKLNLWA